jgi:transcriptional regulator with XRE-family HTH domain
MEQTRSLQIGSRIREARTRHAWTLDELSRFTDRAITPSRLANYENGIRRPDIEEAEALANAFGDVSAAWLLTLDEERRPDAGSA